MKYTYLIGWSAQDKFYYGVRYSKNADVGEFWVSYFTSSKYVKEYRILYGEPDIIEIRRIFDTAKDALEWESRVLTKLGVPRNPKFLNRTNNKAILYERNDEWRKKRSGVNHHMYGKPSPFKGKKHSEESKQKNRIAHIGKKTGRTSGSFTEEWKSKISSSLKGRIRQQSTEERATRSIVARSSGFSKVCAGRIWITNGVENKRILEKDLHLYQEFRRGRVNLNHTSNSSQPSTSYP